MHDPTTSPAQPAPAAEQTAPRGRPRRAAKLDLAKIAPRQALPLTLAELCALYTAQHPDERDMAMHLRKWLDDFGLAEREAWSLTTEELLNGYTAMVEVMDYAQATANRDLATFGSLYRFAADKKLSPVGFVSPTLAIRRKAAAIRYVEPARPGEWEAMRAAARIGGDAMFTLFVWLIMDTACRRSEITDRLWSDFVLDDATDGPHLVLMDTKTDRPRRVYFSRETASLLRRLRPAEKYRQALAFAGRGGSPRKYQKAWNRYRTCIGRPELHVHDLRHMVAAELLKAGKGMSQVASLLGHSTLVLHTRYGHLDDAAVRDMQAERLRLDEMPDEFAPVAQARARQAEREANAPAEAAAEAERLALLAQEALAAAQAAAQALAAMRNGAGVQA